MKPTLRFTHFFCLAIFVLLLPLSIFAHGDEVPTDLGVAKDHFTAYGQSDRYELTCYYPELKAGQPAHLTLFVADYKTNRPIDKAELKISAMEDAKMVFEVKVLSPGVYELHSTFKGNKIYTLNVQINHPNGADLIGVQGIAVGKKLNTGADVAISPTNQAAGHWLWLAGGILLGGLGMWVVSQRRSRVLTILLLLASAWFSTPNLNPVFAHGDEDHGPAAGGTSYGKTVFAPKETQFLFEISTQPIEKDDYQSAATVFGTVIPSSGGMGTVVVPQSGRITRVNVQVGQSVRAGQTLAVLQQNVGTPDQVNIAANNAGLAVQIETEKARLAAAKREYERLRKIEDIAAGRDVQAAEAAFNAARIELQTLEKSAVSANASANQRTVTLQAPIAGIIGAFTLTPGSEVVAGQTLFTVTNLNKIYVEAQVFSQDLPTIQAGNTFLVTSSTDDQKAAEVRLISQAQSLDPGNQSQRVLFEMVNPQGTFKIGEFVTIKAVNQQSSREIAVPNTALTEINGKTAIFHKRAPEQYELSYVQTGANDGSRTLILKGLEESKRIVVSGVYEVKMMYLNQ